MGETELSERPMLRPATMLARPVWVDPAFADPDAVIALIRRSAPYPLSARVHKRDDTGTDVPFFRIFWAHTRQVRVPGAEPFFLNDRFIDAARESFGARVIEPSAIMINLNLPMAGGPPHRDLPYFRGAEKFPFWLLQCMGYSNLFHDWAVPIASMLTWFYRGEGGPFEYWPDGPDAPSKLVRPPLWNVGVVADNEYMWHRVGAVGPAAQQKQPGEVTREVRLHAMPDGGWEMRDQDRVERWNADQVRISILWKAYAFADQAAADAYHDHTHDLDHQMVAGIFARDMRGRGLDVTPPEDPVTDAGWKALLQRTYPPAFTGDAAYVD